MDTNSLDVCRLLPKTKQLLVLTAGKGDRDVCNWEVGYAVAHTVKKTVQWNNYWNAFSWMPFSMDKCI